MKYLLTLLAVLFIAGCGQKTATKAFVLSYGNLADVSILVDGNKIEMRTDGSGTILNINGMIKNNPFTVDVTISPNPNTAGGYSFGLAALHEDESFSFLIKETIKLPIQSPFHKTWTIRK